MWAALAALLAALWVWDPLCRPGEVPGGSRGSSGRSLWDVFLRSTPIAIKKQFFWTCVVVQLRLFLALCGVVCCLPCGEPGAGAHREKQVFAWRVCRFSHVGLLCARPKKHGKRDETPYRKQTKRSVISARGRSQKTHPKLIDLGAPSAPKSTPDIPKATQEASRSGWMTTAAKSRGQERAPSRLQGLPSPSCGEMPLSPGAPGGLRVTGFAHPGPLGTDNYQRKAI